MAGMPERIGKGPIFRRLDDRYEDSKLRGIALQRLKDPANQNIDVADIGMQQDSAGNTVLSSQEGDHIKDHWFNRNSKGWWGARYVKDILKWGLIAALEEADKGGVQKPIKTLWICSGPRGNAPFEVYVYPTETQVTLIVFSPDLPGSEYADPNPFEEDNIWVVKRIHDIPANDGQLDGRKGGDVDLQDLGNNIKIIKRQPRTLPGK
jgi:hypothetical protein